MTMTEPTIAVPAVCHECDGDLLRWHCRIKPDLNPMRRGSVEFFLGCEECSETLAWLSDDEFIEYTGVNAELYATLEKMGF